MSEEQMNYEEGMEEDLEEINEEAFEDVPEEVDVEENKSEEVAEEIPEPEMEVVEPPKKRRGRPRKDASAKAEVKAEPESEPADEMVEPPKKRRGRPRKDASAAATQEVVKEEAPKRRGRPRKSEQAEAQVVETVKRPVRTGGKIATTFSLTAGKETKSVDDYVAMVEATYAGSIKTLDINLDINTQRIIAKINETIELSFPV